MPLPESLQREMHETYGELMRRAQASGELRADLVLDDIPMFMCGIGMGALQDAHLPGRLEAPPGDHDRRPARDQRHSALPNPRCS